MIILANTPGGVSPELRVGAGGRGPVVERPLALPPLRRAEFSGSGFLEAWARIERAAMGAGRLDPADLPGITAEPRLDSRMLELVLAALDTASLPAPTPWLISVVEHPRVDAGTLTVAARLLGRWVEAGRVDRDSAVAALGVLATHPGHDRSSLLALARWARRMDRATPGALWRLIEADLMRHPAHAHGGASFEAVGLSKVAAGEAGLVATGSPYATAAAERILERGGNAADAAAAALLALCVTDPANTSFAGGRSQILACIDGEMRGLDAGTQEPAGVPPLAPGQTHRGWQAAPIAGNPAAIAALVEELGSGKLTLAEVAAPAIALCRDGFALPPKLADVWGARAEKLRKDTTTRSIFLKPDRTAYRAGERVVQPELGRTLETFARGGADAFYRGPLARRLAAHHAQNGGFVTHSDLRAYRASQPELLRCRYRDYEIVTLGSNTWGHTIVEGLQILERFDLAGETPSAEQAETLALVLTHLMADRPEQLGTLAPKPGGMSLQQLLRPELAQDRAEGIRRLVAGAGSWTQELAPLFESMGEKKLQRDRDTSHLSVTDRLGNVVSLTTSIGPHFGAGVTALGSLLGFSYRQSVAPQPGAIDRTEKTPVLVLKDGKPVAVVGAAGSERIPQAVLQVLVNLIDRGQPLAEAVSAPRMGIKNGQLRMHIGWDPALVCRLRERGFDVKLTGRGHKDHLGIVAATSTQQAAADLSWDGTAAAPT